MTISKNDNVEKNLIFDFVTLANYFDHLTWLFPVKTEK